MSIKEIKRFNNGLNGFLSKFICDSVLDLANMPTSGNGVVIGSTVLCLENKTEYMLSNSDQWLEIRDAYATVTYVDGKISSVFRPSGNWNANTNTPTLANNESTNTGKVYYVTNAGTQFGLTFAIGDKLAFIEDGVATKWDNIDDVTTVNGKVGTVVINADDIPFDGSGTNYLTAKTEVESAVKELDTRVKTNADNVALKVNTGDIVDNLTSTDTNKPLSANQGKVLQDTKADTTHTHTKSQITDFPTTMTPTAHTHTKSEITDFPTSMPPTAHNHDSDYYKKTEIDTMIGDIETLLGGI